MKIILSKAIDMKYKDGIQCMPKLNCILNAGEYIFLGICQMIFTILFIFIALLSCHKTYDKQLNFTVDNLAGTTRIKNDSLDKIDLPKFLWKTAITENAVSNTIQPLITSDRIIISKSLDTPPEVLLCFSKANGKLLWTWNDYFDKRSRIGSVEHYFIQQNLMYLSTKGSLYIIDLMNGKTEFKQNFGKNVRAGTYGDNGLVSLTYSTDSSQVAALFNTETHKLITCGSFLKNSAFKGSMSIPYVVNKTCYFSFCSFDYAANKTLSVLYRVDLVGDTAITRWELKIPTISVLGIRGYQVLGNRLYVMDRDLYCINTDNSSILWKYPDIQGGLCGLIIADNKLIVGSSHIDSYLYAFDLLTGDVLWKEPFENSASPLQYHNGVIYSVASNLIAFDIKSGKRVYDLSCPYKSDNQDSYFVNCAVDTATNSIILTNYRYIMRYQLPLY